MTGQPQEIQNQNALTGNLLGESLVAHPPDPSLSLLAREILGEAFEQIRTLGGGGNSRLYLLQNPRRAIVLKHYPVIAGDQRRRYAVEATALQFFAAVDMNDVPRWLGGREPYGFLSVLPGAPIREIAAGDMAQALGFLQRLHRARIRPAAQLIPRAFQASISLNAVGAEIEVRLDRLVQALADRGALAAPKHRNRQAHSSAPLVPTVRSDSATVAGPPTSASGAALAIDQALSAFLQNEMLPWWHVRFEHARACYEEYGWPADALPAAGFSLVPGDFGFHNTLRDDDGTLRFLDFEYFGWDDPVKLAADMLWHPAMPLEPTQQVKLRPALCEVYRDDRAFASRLAILEPLYAMRWLCIILNEFLPAAWQARRFATEEDDWSRAKKRKLELAQARLSCIRDAFPAADHA